MAIIRTTVIFRTGIGRRVYQDIDNPDLNAIHRNVSYFAQCSIQPVIAFEVVQLSDLSWEAVQYRRMRK